MRRSPPHSMLTGLLLARVLLCGPPSRSVLISLASDGRGEESLPVNLER
jgi:hypothetical protein